MRNIGIMIWLIRGHLTLITLSNLIIWVLFKLYSFQLDLPVSACFAALGPFGTALGMLLGLRVKTASSRFLLANDLWRSLKCHVLGLNSLLYLILNVNSSPTQESENILSRNVEFISVFTSNLHNSLMPRRALHKTASESLPFDSSLGPDCFDQWIRFHRSELANGISNGIIEAGHIRYLNNHLDEIQLLKEKNYQSESGSVSKTSQIDDQSDDLHHGSTYPCPINPNSRTCYDSSRTYE